MSDRYPQATINQNVSRESRELWFGCDDDCYRLVCVGVAVVLPVLTVGHEVSFRMVSGVGMLFASDNQPGC